MKSPRNPTRTRSAGFTLIEILIVMAIMGLVLAIFVGRGPAAHPVLDLRTAAANVAEQLRVARSRAIASDQPCAFVLDLAAHSFRVAGGPAQKLPTELALKVTTVAGAVARRSAEIGFAPDGSSTGGRIELAAGDRKATVDVNWLTGRVSIDAK